MTLRLFLIVLFAVILFACCEDGEIYASVRDVTHEIGVLRKVVVFSMLENENSIFFKQFVLEYKVGYCA